MVAPEALESLSIEEAQKWFQEVYLPSLPISKSEGAGKSHHRKAAWHRALKPKNIKNKEFIWVPVDYEGPGRSGVILYDENTLYRLELDKYFIQPIIEGLIVMKTGQQIQAFLAQIAYDPIALAASGCKLEKANFTGTLLRADWHDHLIDGTAFHKGEMVKGFAKPADGVVRPANAIATNARTADCFYYSVVYQTWYVGDDGILTVVGHLSWATVCDGSGNGGWGDSGSGYGGYGDPGGGGVTSGGTNGGAYYDPLVNSGGGWHYPTNILFDYDLNKAIATNGTDRQNMNANLLNAMKAVELGTSISTWSLQKADALAKSIGLNLVEAFPLVYKGVTRVGYATAIYGGVKAVISVTDGEITQDDVLTFAAGTLGVAMLFTAGWTLVGLGAVSILITIYQESQKEPG